MEIDPTDERVRLPLVAKKRSSSHARGRSGLPPATDIRAVTSAFALISSAIPPGADSQDGGAVGPKVTQSSHGGFCLTGSNGEGAPRFAVGPSVLWDGVVYRVLASPSEFEVDAVGHLPITEIRIAPRRPFHSHEVHPIDTQRNL